MNNAAMQDITDDTLSAYLDHELDATRRAQVDAAIVRNPRVAQRLAELHEADSQTRELFASTEDEAIPVELQQMLFEQAADKRPKQPRPPAKWWHSRPLQTLAGGVAMGLLLSLLAPWSLLTGGMTAARLPLRPAAVVATALNTVASGTLYAADHTTVAPLTTFRTKNGQVCREYQARMGSDQPATISAVACRGQSSNWRNEVVVSLSDAGGQGYTPASAEDALKAMRPEWRNAEVLEPEQEQTLLQHWAAAAD